MLLVLSTAAACARPTFSTAACTRARSAIALMNDPGSVLTFWFGSEWYEGGMDSADYEKAQIKRWFMGGQDMDEQSRRFVPLIRAAGNDELHDEWDSRDGLVAQLVLLDQCSRNAFRGTEEAFAYDGAAQRVTSRLLNTPGALDLPAPAALFISTCLMHSEELALHDRCRAFLEAHTAASASPLLLRQLEDDLPAHTEVLRRFGRYPHRNALKQRATTEEEARWLASDDRPGWARSQLAAPCSAMGELIVVDSSGTRAAHAALAGRATERWPEWRSAPCRFQESRWWEASGREQAAEERCLVTEGRASLWPEGGDDAIEIAAGDWVTFKRGFLCEWVVHETIAKKYAYFDAAGAEISA